MFAVMTRSFTSLECQPNAPLHKLPIDCRHVALFLNSIRDKLNILSFVMVNSAEEMRSHSGISVLHGPSSVAAGSWAMLPHPDYFVEADYGQTFLYCEYQKDFPDWGVWTFFFRPFDVSIWVCLFSVFAISSV